MCVEIYLTVYRLSSEIFQVWVQTTATKQVQAFLEDITGLVPLHCNKARIMIKTLLLMEDFAFNLQKTPQYL